MRFLSRLLTIVFTLFIKYPFDSQKTDTKKIRLSCCCTHWT